MIDFSEPSCILFYLKLAVYSNTFLYLRKNHPLYAGSQVNRFINSAYPCILLSEALYPEKPA